MATQPMTPALVSFAAYAQCRTFNHTYLFKSKPDQTLTLKIFDQAQQKLIKIAAPVANLSQWSKIENAQTLLSLFIQHNLIPSDFLPSAPVVNPLHDLQQLILLAKSKVSVETDNMKQFTCPITLEVFEDPVIDEHGHTFERSAITEHLQRHRDTCPISRQPINSLTPNRSLKEAIDELKKQDPIPTFAFFGRPNSVLFGKNLETALSCVEEKEYDEALDSYAKAFKYTNDWRHYVELPKLFEKISTPAKATLAYLYLVLYQLQDSKLTEALQTLEHCKKITPLSQQIDKLLIYLYHANKQTDQAIKLALQSAQTLASTNPQEALRLYRQVLSFDPCQWAVYQPLSLLLTIPQEKAHILLKGACHALDIKECKIAQEFSKEAEKNYEDSFIDRLIDLEYLSKQSPLLLKGKLLTLAQAYEQKKLIPAMVKVYKRLTRLAYDPMYYQKIILHTPNQVNIIPWSLAWLSDAIENKDWPSAEQVAKTALKLTKEPIPILCQLATVYTYWHDHELNNLWNQLGSAYLRTSQIDLAERTYRKAYERLHSLENALALGDTLHRQSKIPESIQVYYDASILALLNDNLENLDLCLRNILQMDPTLGHLTQAQKIHVVTQSQIIKLSTKLQQTDAELKQLKEQMKSAEVQTLPKAQAAATIASPPIEKPVVLPLTPLGKKAWETYFGEVGAEPPLPPDIKQILKAPCPFVDGKKVFETHLLVLVPQTHNGLPLTLKTLRNLVKKPLTGSATQYSGFDLGQYTDRAAPPSHWVLLTRDVIEGSRNKSYQDQQAFLHKKGHGVYAVPTLLDATVCIFMEYVCTGTRLYPAYPFTFTRCQERFSDDLQLGVGGYSKSGLEVGMIDCFNERSGVGGSRKF
jgi:hypothetical protein